MSLDFPRAWQIARAAKMEDHHEMCSFRQTNGGILCDCDVIHKHPEYTDDVLHSVDGVEYKKCDHLWQGDKCIHCGQHLLRMPIARA